MFGIIMRILLVALRGVQYLRRSGVAKYRVSEQEDIGGHGRRLRFVNENVYSKTFNIQVERVRHFTTLHVSTLILQIYIAFAPRTKRRLYVLRCGRRLVKIVPNDLCVFSVQWKTWPSDDMTSSMSRIFYLRINPRELLVLSLGSIAYDTKARLCCPLHH